MPHDFAVEDNFDKLFVKYDLEPQKVCCMRFVPSHFSCVSSHRPEIQYVTNNEMATWIAKSLGMNHIYTHLFRVPFISHNSRKFWS